MSESKWTSGTVSAACESVFSDTSRNGYYVPICDVRAFPSNLDNRPVQDRLDEMHANRDRIVACWNACDGIADPAEAIELAKELSLYAASSELQNTPEFIDGLFDRITKVQAALGECEGFGSRKRPTLEELQREYDSMMVD